MEIQNPDYKYYKQLAGTWKSADGACIVTLTEHVGINMEYGGAVLNGNYGVIPTGPMVAPDLQGFMGLGMMMGMPGSSGDMVSRHDPSEDIQLKLGDRSLKNGDQIIYIIEFIWHDIADKLHVELSNAATGIKTSIVLNREIASVVTASTAGSNEGETQCECGTFFSSKFCPNCGKMRRESNTFTCSCGYTGPVSNFCPECGRLCSVKDPGNDPASAATQTAVQDHSDDGVITPEQDPAPGAGWTCSQCGAKLQTGDSCSECGAEIRKEPLFAISEYCPTNPPRYDGIKVWKFSDTQLIMQHGSNFSFIPATVIEPAMEIIREHEIDKWEEYKDHFSGMMGSSQSVSYWDGEKMAGTSTDHMQGAAGAYCALMDLFTTAARDHEHGSVPGNTQ